MFQWFFKENRDRFAWTVILCKTNKFSSDQLKALSCVLWLVTIEHFRFATIKLHQNIQFIYRMFKLFVKENKDRFAGIVILCKTNELKTLDTFGNCQRPVFSLAVSQHA